VELEAPLPFNNQNGGNYSNSFNNQPSIKDLVFGQARINESINKKLAANEKVLQNLNSIIESFTSAVKNQLSFNKMIETQLAQLAASLPSSESGGIPRQPEPTREHVSTIYTRWGKPSRGVYAPNHVGKPAHQIQDPWTNQQSCTIKTMDIQASRAQSTSKRSRMLSVALERVSTSCPKPCLKS
jgi:hypothetical protein